MTERASPLKNLRLLADDALPAALLLHFQHGEAGSFQRGDDLILPAVDDAAGDEDGVVGHQAGDGGGQRHDGVGHDVGGDDVVLAAGLVGQVAHEDGQLVGIVENTTFKGVHYEMSVRCGRCEILIHSTKSAEIGSKIGMRVIPFNIQIMNKLLPFYDNVIEATVTYANQNDNSFEFELEGETVTVPDKYYEEGTKLKIALPPDALSLAGDGVGDLKDLYIESVVYKGEQNEIILESDERKWLMLSDTDEQVATYVPLSFDFSKARFEVISEFSEKEG